MHPDTLAVHADRSLNETPALAPPIFQTSTFRAATAQDYARSASEPMHDHFYTRYGNPNHSQAGAVIAALEHAQTALIFPSGMAALSAAVLTLCSTGDHIVAQRNMYAGTQNVLEDVLARFGVTCTFVDQTDAQNFAGAVRDTTRAFIVESPSNPLMTVTDLRAVAGIARDRGIVTIADNTFATPVNTRPLDLGIDIAMHSATKYLGGHSDLSAGALACSRRMAEKIWPVCTKLGYAINGFDSWLLLRGMRTLNLRIARQNANAGALAALLAARTDIAAVHYPGLPSHPQHQLASSQMAGFGSMLSFELGGTAGRVEDFITRLQIISRASSLGGIETTLVHQSAMWASAMSVEDLAAAGIAPTLIRLSAGIEHIDDLAADLASALENTP